MLCSIEGLYRLFSGCAATGALHAKGEGQLQVQALAGGRLQPLRVFHYVPHCAQHHPAYDEGELKI